MVKNYLRMIQDKFYSRMLASVTKLLSFPLTSPSARTRVLFVREPNLREVLHSYHVHIPTKRSHKGPEEKKYL